MKWTKQANKQTKNPTNHPGNCLWPITWDTTATASQHPDPPTGPGTSLHARWKLRTKNRAPTLCSAVSSSTSEKQGEYSSCEAALALAGECWDGGKPIPAWRRVSSFPRSKAAGGQNYYRWTAKEGLNTHHTTPNMHWAGQYCTLLKEGRKA